MTLYIPYASLLVAKLVRVTQELYASKSGYISFGGDDHYHRTNTQTDIHEAAVICKLKFKMDDAEFCNLVESIRINYMNWYKKVRGLIHEKYVHTEFCEPFEIWSNMKNYTPAEKMILSKVIVIENEQTLLLVGNHVFLGGYLLSQFLQVILCQKVHKNIFPKNKYYPLLTETMILAYLTRSALRKPHKKIPCYENAALQKRYSVSYNVEDLKNMGVQENVDFISCLIAKYVYIIMQSMNRTILRVCLPVSFEDENSFNTVGAVVIDIKMQSTIGEMARNIKKQIRRNRYDASTTHHIQKILPTHHLSSKVRNMVDITFTLAPQKVLPDNHYEKYLIGCEFTMKNITYPVYIMTFIFKKQIHSSFIINSPEFDTDLMEKNYPEIYRTDLKI